MNKKSFAEIMKSPKKFITVFLLGFSSGLPIMVIYGSIKLWLRRYEIDLPKIGLFSWIAVAYSFNFLWAFLFDRYTPLKKVGRRRSWLLITQIMLVGCFLLLSLGNPDKSLTFIAVAGTLLCFFSASQDVAVDAYRNEILNSEELGIGASLGVYGYRVAMWVASGFGIWVVDEKTWNWSFNQMFLMLAAFMGIGLLTTLWADEPTNTHPKEKSFFDSVLNPFFEFLNRDGTFDYLRNIKRPSGDSHFVRKLCNYILFLPKFLIKEGPIIIYKFLFTKAFFILAFIFFFKFGDSIAGSMSRPFYADLGFSNEIIGKVASTVGLFSTLAGLIVGGSLIYKLGYRVTLWFAGISQALTTGMFALLATYSTNNDLAKIVFLEDFTSGIGTAALVGFMGHLTNQRFTASQYALFASLASLGRTLFSGTAGKLIVYLRGSPVFASSSNHIGYVNFYILCALFAIPGLIFLAMMKKEEFQ